MSAVATCIGCGCDDDHACPSRCHWLRVDYGAGAGVCSECPTHEARWAAGDRAPNNGKALTLFMCGPSHCDHDYSRYEPIIQNGREVGETAVCSKCGRTAFEEAAWL